jgi:hypothetical protein
VAVVMRRKELSPDRTNYLEIGLKKNSAGQYETVRVTQYLNKAAVPPLGDTWKLAVPKHFPKGLSQREIRYLEMVAANYVNERVVRTNPIAWNDLLGELRELSDASKHLLGQINNRGLGSGDSIWQRVLKEAPPGNLALPALRSLLSTLSDAIQAALARAVAEKSGGRKRDYTEPWFRLVNELADLFELKVGKATAAKNLRNLAAANPSPFVEFVWTIVTSAVPIQLREHTASKNAMSKAVSDVLVRPKTGKERPAGPFHEMLCEINPVTKA